MIRAVMTILAVATVLFGGNSAAAQQDGNGNGRYEVCVLTTGEHEGQVNFEIAELSAEEMANSNISHVSYYQPNADGTCPATHEEATLIPRESLPAPTIPGSSVAETPATEVVPQFTETSTAPEPPVASAAASAAEPGAETGSGEESSGDLIPVCITAFETALHVAYVTAEELVVIQSGALEDEPLVSVAFGGYPDTSGSCVTDNGVLKPEFVSAFMICIPNSEGVLVPQAAISHYITDPSSVIVADPTTGACPSGDGSDTPVPIAWFCRLSNSPIDGETRWYFTRGYAVEVSVEEQLARYPYFSYRIAEDESCPEDQFESELAAEAAVSGPSSNFESTEVTPIPGPDGVNQPDSSTLVTISGGIESGSTPSITPTLVAIVPASTDSTAVPGIEQIGEAGTISYLLDEWTIEVKSVELRQTIQAANGQVLKPQNEQFLIVWFDQASPSGLPLPLGNFSLGSGIAIAGIADPYEVAEPATVALIGNEYEWSPSQMDANTVYRTGVVFDVNPDIAQMTLRYEMGGNEFMKIDIDS